MARQAMQLIGTAGHIDHGKSTLVQALTGVHPSRLPEEHARGMTIDLGYAYLDHPDGFRLGIVDVPGHERLVKNMVAGATGFELALWVVDARESVMPQSREHLHILDLLGVRALLPVVTKAALATADEIAATHADVTALLATHGVPTLPIHTVDSLSGAGIPALAHAIFDATRHGVAAIDEPSGPYLPIDRVFSVKGVGTVVTGTLVRGTLAEGDAVAVTSQPGVWRARALTNHHERVARIGAGARVGVNLAGLPADAVHRGDVLVAPGHPYRGRVVNARVRWTPNAPRAWPHGARLHFHTGCVEMACRLWDASTDGDALGDALGDAAWAQLELARETAFVPGQRFILRGGTPLATVGGGTVLDLAPDRPRRVTPAEREAYARRMRDEPCLTAYHAAGGARVLDLAALAGRWMMPEASLRDEAARDPARRVAAPPSPLTWTTDTERLVIDTLRSLVDETPREQTVPYESLGRALRVARALVQPLLRAVLAADAVASLDLPLRLDGAGLVVHPGRGVLAAEEREVAAALLARLRADWLRPATLDAYRAAFPVTRGTLDDVVAALVADGRVVRVRAERGDLLLHADAAASLRGAPAHHGLDGVRAAAFGQALGVSRKYGVAYLEYLGREGILRREGDLHFLA